MRIATWNLAGRWSPQHEALMLEVTADVWLLTEVHHRATQMALCPTHRPPTWRPNGTGPPS